ncbi:hypothetical protein L1987_26598 [Smallanthus sonchifolius]|uniref:Uncharacterized protein n=1 Tax=Smallanthus sonchifolius TaxID=185202 RepID=A0ACB9I976_9ASTR|nr:hypothetical protein L1987_26598 [Smallanthus sonchifolius]
MDEGSSKRKKRKRGISLIFKTLFPQTTAGDDNAGKISASDDNLVYCDVTNNGIHGDPYAKTKSSSSRGRMSTIFKAVLFDTAMKKMRGKKPSKPTTGSTNSAPVLDEKTDNSFNKNDQNVVKVLEADNNSSNDGSNAVSLSPESDASQVASPGVDTGSHVLTERKITSPVGSQTLTEGRVASLIGSQTLTERKVTSTLNSTDKKPPLPSGLRSPVKLVSERPGKPATLNNSMISRLCLLIVLVVFVSVVLWMSFKSNVTESPNLDSGPDMNIVVVGDEL